MENSTKKCAKCHINLPYSEFRKCSRLKDGLISQCRKCIDKTTSLQRLKIKETIKEIPSEKKCSYCKKTKTSDKFNKYQSNKDGLYHQCKDCRKLISIERKKKKEIEEPIIIDNTIKKVCKKCNIEKELSMYKIHRSSSDKFSHICIDCSPKKNQRNKEKEKETRKIYKINNREKIKERNKIQGKKINNRIKNNLSRRIRYALLSKNITKRNKTFEYIGCDIDFFKKWLEFQFTEEMNWENYSEWHLDHVKPCSSFDLSDLEQAKICFNWKNLQPLWANDNIIKSDKIDEKLIESHKEKANNYEKMINTIIT